MKFNRWLATAVREVEVIFDKVKFLPVHLRFLDGVNPRHDLFDVQNNLLLSNTGAALFKQSVFQLAGFMKNK